MALKIITAASAASSADANEYFVNTRYIVKPSNQTRVSSPGFQDDNDLIMHVDASKTYQVDVFVQFTSPTAAGFDFTFTGAGGYLLYGNAISGSVINSPDGASSSVVAYDGTQNLLTGTMSIPATPGSGRPALIQVSGILVTSGSAGNFTFRWRQTASNAGNTTVYAGSSMIMRRVS